MADAGKLTAAAERVRRLEFSDLPGDDFDHIYGSYAEWEHSYDQDYRALALAYLDERPAVAALHARVTELESELRRVAPFLAARGVAGYRFGPPVPLLYRAECADCRATVEGGGNDLLPGQSQWLMACPKCRRQVVVTAAVESGGDLAKYIEGVG